MFTVYAAVLLLNMITQDDWRLIFRFGGEEPREIAKYFCASYCAS